LPADAGMKFWVSALGKFIELNLAARFSTISTLGVLSTGADTKVRDGIADVKFVELDFAAGPRPSVPLKSWLLMPA
jgi:hypothetical protein